MTTMTIRAAEPGEIDRLARLWYDAHAEIRPAELERRCTLESFRGAARGRPG